MTAGNENGNDEKPPFFRTWKAMYIAVIANLVLLIILFYCFKLYFS